MKILHVSDTHGLLPALPDVDECDVIVHSGDFMPNRSRGKVDVETAYQMQWLHDNRATLVDWVRGKPFVFVQGNHDFINPCPTLVDFGIDATNITDRPDFVHGVMWRGFSPIRRLDGEWANEATEEQIESALYGVDLAMDGRPTDVFVSHGPMYGVLDETHGGVRCGSVALRHYFLDQPVWPQALLHGHIHESDGQYVFRDGIRSMLVSNAAWVPRLVEVFV